MKEFVDRQYAIDFLRGEAVFANECDLIAFQHGIADLLEQDKKTMDELEKQIDVCKAQIGVLEKRIASIEQMENMRRNTTWSFCSI